MQHVGHAISRWSGEPSQQRFCVNSQRRRPSARRALARSVATLCEALECRCLLAQVPAVAAAAAAAHAALKVTGAKDSLGSGSISGQVYKDVNGTGAYDAAEDILFNGVTVYLDIDGTPGFSGGDPTQTTAGSGTTAGTYTFTGLDDGIYTVGEVTPTGYIRSGAVTQSATVTGGGAVTGKNLGNFPVVFTGTNGTDTWTIKMKTSGGTMIQIAESLLGSGTTWSILKTSLPSITINANSGDDILTVDYINGDPIPGTGINFDGSIQTSPQGDRVTVLGNGGADVITMTNYNIAHDVGGIAVQGIESSAISSGLGNDTITLGTSIGVQVVTDGQGGTDTVTYNGTGGVDSISVGVGSIVDGAATQTISNVEQVQINAQGGNDQVTVVASGGADTIDITTNSVTTLGGLFLVTVSQTEVLRVDAGDGSDTINVNSATSAMPVSVFGGNGDDVLTVASASNGAITYDGATGTNTAVFNTSGGADDLTIAGGTVVLMGRSLGQTNVQRLVVNTWGGFDHIAISATPIADAVTINAGDGNDTLTITANVPPTIFNGGLLSSDYDLLEVFTGVYNFDSDAKLSTANLVVNIALSGQVNFNSTQHIDTLNVAGRATLTAGGNKVLSLKSLSVTGKLDLTNNDLIVNYAGTSPLGTWNGSNYTGIAGMIQTGFNGGAWDQNGLITSLNDSLIGVYAGLGAAESADILGITGTQTEVWSGETVDATCVLVKFTYIGDADLNGELNGDDYFYLDSHVLQSGSVFLWHNGDYDYTGEINGDDYFYLDSSILAAVQTL